MRINVEYSTQHWIFPIITIGVLVILGVLLIALEGRARVKAGGSFFAKPGRFFAENYDKFKFWGCIVLMIVYFFFLDKLGFTFWSMWWPACSSASCSAPCSQSPCPPDSSPSRFRPWASSCTEKGW